MKAKKWILGTTEADVCVFRAETQAWLSIYLRWVICQASHIEQYKTQNQCFDTPDCLISILFQEMLTVSSAQIHLFLFLDLSHITRKNLGGIVLIDGDSWPFLTDKNML